MAHLDPHEAFEHFRDRVVEGIRTHFPMQGKTRSITLDKIEVKDELHPDDIRGQVAAKIKGNTWAVPVYGHLTLKDNITGDVLSSRRVRLAEIPKATSRYSFVVDGQEYQIDNQWQLKPSIYTRRRQNGELESRFNVAGKSAFDLLFDPASKQFHMEYNKSKLPLYPLLRTMGVDDASLEQTWGKEILDANKGARGAAGAVERFYKSDRKTNAPSKEAAEEHLRATLAASRLRPDATQLTVGKPFESVTGEALHLATHKMLKVQAGHPEDDRDSLIFKDLRTAGDFAHDKIRAAARTVQQKVGRKINTATDVRDVVRFDLFNDPIKQTFHKNSAARVATQVNPVEMVASALQTTIMGPGGIQSEQSIMDEAKFVNASHLGFLDPINTPEGGKTGVTLRLPMGIKKIGNEPHIPLFNIRTGKTELVNPLTFVQSNVVLPDQVKWVNGKPVPLHDRVKMSADKNEIIDGSFGDAHYVMQHPWQMFNITSNLIPFLANTSGNRAGMASRHIEQAISLVHREAPLVQVSTGVGKAGIDTFESLIGRQASHASSIDGHVLEVKKDGIILMNAKGEKREVQLYHNYPLNDAKSVMHSSPLVKVGDRVKAGQTIADTNYSKDGTLALGANLRVSYIPFKGYNFEDGVVISETAAKKLSSVHMHKHNLPLEEGVITDPRKFITEHSGAFKKDQLSKLGDDGVVRVGQRVGPGDPLILAMKPYMLRDRTGLAAIRRSLSGAHTDKSLRWDSDHEGEVVGVHRTGKDITVHVRTVEPMQVGDKLAGRYGNKGIVTMILPDHHMPHTKDKEPIEVALNPSGIPGRMNVGQVFETAAAKIALKTGKPYVVRNFEPVEDMHAQIVADLKKHNLTDEEELFDPVTKQPLGKALVGPQHILKLMHQVDKKLSVRSGMQLPGGGAGEHYDLNLQPTGGAGTGGQSMGVLGMYALLAHGAKANIREMQTIKAEGPDPQTNDAKRWPSQHNQVWAAIQTGTPLPTPAPTFAFHKFTEMLRGAGINMEKKGHQFILTPLTDKQIVHMSTGALTKPAELVFAKADKHGELKPKPGGLFDEKLTGGHGGTKWSHISLAEPIPNPVFEGPIKHLTGLTQKDFDAIVHGARAVTPGGTMTEVGEAGSITGGAAIKHLLDKVDVKKELAAARLELTKAPSSKVDKMLKKVKYLRALDQLGMPPSEAYILHHVPVMPPVLRPVSQLPSGDLKYADVNQLYSEFAQINDQLKNPVIAKHLPETAKGDLRRDLYDGVRAIIGIGVPYADAKHKGIIHQIQGGQPKTGYFQNILMNKRQDLTMRSTIVPEPALGLDEVGLPRHAALKLYSPFVVNHLIQMGAAPTPLQAQKVIAEALDAPDHTPTTGPMSVKQLLDTKTSAKANPAVWQALDRAMLERPVLMKRDPALHKYSVQAFKPKASPGSAIQIHPLVCGGFNADFDGDTMSVFVPVHREAVAEAQRMYPSNNLFSEATGKVMYQPTLESALGLYKMSLVGKDTGKKFAHHGEAIEAVRHGHIDLTDLVSVAGQKTTPGRILLSAALPEPMQKKLLDDHAYRIDKKGLDALLSNLATHHNHDFAEVVNKLKDLGNATAYGNIEAHPGSNVFIPVGTHTLGLKDFVSEKAVRDPILTAAQKKVDHIRAGGGSKTDKDRHAVAVWSQADKDIKDELDKKYNHSPTNLSVMYKAGVKPGWEQLKQMISAPMLLKDSANRTIPTPVTRSYSEGLDLAGYWTGMHGARRGAVMKVQEVQEPGYMSKLLMNNTMHLIVNNHDCGTDKGVLMQIGEKDVHDRHLAQDFNHGDLHVPAGTMLSPDLVGTIRAAKRDAQVLVRSPLKCEEEKGICQTCAGLSTTGHHHHLGTNIGVLAAHAVGERAIQLTLKAFHTGGVAEQGGGGLLNSFAKFQQLTMLPQKIPNAAALAMKSGRIERIEDDPTGAKIWIAGEAHHVPKDASGAPLHKELAHASKLPDYAAWQPPKVGMQVEAGQHLSDPNRTHVNPHHLYEATRSIEAVQNHLTDEIHGLYKGEDIRRVHVEAVVKAMSNLTKIVNPGDHPEVLRGEFRPTSVIKKMNGELAKQKLRPIEHTPVLKGIEMLPLDLQEDWMAKLQHQRLKDTILEAAATRGASSIHGLHPVPGIAFGAEFGLTSTVSKRPEYQHLSNVPAHHY